MDDQPHLIARHRATLTVWLRYRAAKRPRRAEAYDIARPASWRAECNARAAAALNALGGLLSEW